MSVTGDSETGGAPRWWRDPSWWRRAALTYALAFAGALLADAVGLPLPWMLGPFFLCGLVAATGVTLVSVPLGRELGQLAIGLAVGMRFTAATLVATLSLLPAMLGATVYVMAYTMIGAFLFRPLAGCRASTAFFATAAGGVADMANVAEQKGADAASVAVVHALRVSCTVAIVPILAITFGTGGSVIGAPSADPGTLLLLPLVIAGCFGAVWLLKRTPLPNPWLIGPMFLAIGLGASGIARVPVPPFVVLPAQLLIGTWLGCCFRREVLLGLPRVAMAGIVVALFMIAAAFGGANVLALLTGLPLTTSFLALAPAAVTEMVITAKAMQLDAEIVTAFHVMRIFLVCSTILVVYRLYTALRRLGGPRAS
ncbi:Putative ammonia monooxygenase [Oceanicola granulosus HTCC2516]|uniref:Putative ammonia monooxygenase n=1 Tax=Oceanicola granulosus (strain ATCC BAA-861 / DSM 15982 / KCTC 12143 / HTCC2516) TaxID=314256 RepID=Q2CJC1_OCEGH|nr:AbrB family transcriptional regulator [Oceanicola granulosus]EAR52679.1 Putative ammonia monooxygenase [Oceanicola granulosus HTCC2516]